MENILFNKISIAYQNLSETYQNYNRQYSDGYYVYTNDISIVKNDKLVFLNQFIGIPFETFFTEKQIASYHNKKYIESDCVVVTDTTVNIHYDLSLVLYYNLVNYLKEDLQKFLDLLKSEAFKNEFNKFIKIDEHTLSYHSVREVQVIEFFKNHIVNYNHIHHLIYRITNEIIFNDLDGYININITILNKILKWNPEIYDFSRFEIQ